MATKDVFPKPDGEFDDFQKTFIVVVTLNAVAWNIPPTELSDLLPFQTAWAAAYAKTINKKASTTNDRNEKDLARENYEAVLRPFIQAYIQNNKTMTAPQKASTGVKPHDKTRTRVPVPNTVPIVEIVFGFGNSVKLVFRNELDSTGATRRGKPYGVTRMEIVALIDTVPSFPEECTKFGSAQRSPFTMPLDPSMSGKRIYFYVRWINTRGEGGPWSILYNFLVP